MPCDSSLWQSFTGSHTKFVVLDSQRTAQAAQTQPISVISETRARVGRVTIRLAFTGK